ncbi:glycogenin glucosyltransferase [Metarhizium rileyi]|uniref:glycogenin glucosyltransferase n=1 Tax=Metarhizium rileyi (strain RCEF 4871) TaxID=1649241 RepID=A0A5C6GCH7_METRR|nr:glycogenin glucosyltransferase [Metarhizium rileyi]
MSAAASIEGEQLYATLLLSDSYLPGALVLAHSLRDAGTTKPIAVLVTLDSVSAAAITQLKAVYDYVLPVPRIRNEQPANLQLMNRSDLHSTFTKINLWKQTQFSKIVYVDADVVAYRAPDELFELPHTFSAAPDIGWPDLVNTGVMVLTPNMGDYYAMLAMAERGISFDGADQGLINTHFKHGVNRLSFTYNVTPSAHYQYVPAYRHFQSSISMVHFIGATKPWFSGRNTSRGDTPFDEMVGRWWAVYDHHYREQESTSQAGSRQISSQHTDRGLIDMATLLVYPSTRSRPGSDADSNASHPHMRPATNDYPSWQISNNVVHSNTSGSPSMSLSTQHRDSIVTKAFLDRHETGHAKSAQESALQSQKHGRNLTMSSWDAQRHPPPLDSKPEAMNFPSTHYEMSRDAKPFVPPVRYPSPPKNMWAPQSGDSVEQHQEPTPVDALATLPEESTSELGSGGILAEHTQPPSVGADSSATGGPWSSYSRVNAWDDVPGIGRYVEGLQRRRSSGSQVRTGDAANSARSPVFDQALQIPKAFKVTDFPTEVERPSLPVTPAPIRRPSFWGDIDEPVNSAEKGQVLPLAEGVPSQSDWVCVHGMRWSPADCRCYLADVRLPHKDPAAQLQMLAQQQSEVLLRKLSGDAGVPGRRPGHEIPSRPLPFGSQPSQSPTYVAQASSTSVLSPQPVQGRSPAVGIVGDLADRDDASSL